MATPLERSELLSLEQYALQRDEFRARVIAHKRPRRVGIGPNLYLYFEDRLTMQYQVQEMLRIERIFEPEGIEEELGAYNPLIPTGSNLKATAMLEYPDVAERKRQLALLSGIEDRIWLRVEGHGPVFAIANEDLERSNEEKTSAVHFMRFELEPGMIAALRKGAALTLGSDHPRYRHETEASGATVESLLADFD
jgi:hypothetical protein